MEMFILHVYVDVQCLSSSLSLQLFSWTLFNLERSVELVRSIGEVRGFAFQIGKRACSFRSILNWCISFNVAFTSIPFTERCTWTQNGKIFTPCYFIMFWPWHWSSFHTRRGKNALFSERSRRSNFQISQSRFARSLRSWYHRYLARVSQNVSLSLHPTRRSRISLLGSLF